MVKLFVFRTKEIAKNELTANAPEEVRVQKAAMKRFYPDGTEVLFRSLDNLDSVVGMEFDEVRYVGVGSGKVKYIRSIDKFVMQ